MVTILFEVNKLAIAYALQRRKIREFGINQFRWNKLFKGITDASDETFLNGIKRYLENECREAKKLKEKVERKWRLHEQQVLSWIRNITKVDFKEPSVRVYVVPVVAGLTPFKDLALIIVGKTRKGWDYPETIAHELAHVLFNQNFNLDPEIGHPYIQLIEEEVAVRLGVRSRYFDYEIPTFATWVHKAKQKEEAWKHYLHRIQKYENILEFIMEEENLK
jgi:hypothetical protein